MIIVHPTVKAKYLLGEATHSVSLGILTHIISWHWKRLSLQLQEYSATMSMKLRWMDGYATPGFFLRVSLVGPVWGELRLSDLREALLRGLRVERRLRSLVTGRPRCDVSFMVRSVYGAHFPLKAVFIFVSVQEPRCMSVRVCSNYPKKWVPLSERCPELSLVIPKSGPLVSRMSEMATWSAGGASDETTPSPVRGLAA